MFSTFYTKPEESLQSNRIYDRPLVLVASKKAYDHFVDYTTEKHRMAILAEKEAKRLTDMKKATVEMSKTWDNTIENVRKKKEEELLAKSKREEEENMQFMEQIASRKAAEHAEVINEARKLLFYTKPQCRLINRALVTSECFRELDAQLQFQKNLKLLAKEHENECAEKIKQEVKKREEEERKNAEKFIMKNKKYSEELKKQIRQNEKITKLKEESEKEAEKRELANILKMMEMGKESEIEETKKRRQQLREQLLKALEEKKNHELKIKRDEEFQERAMEVYNKGKRQIERKLKHQLKKEKEEKIRRSEYLAKKCSAIAKSRVKEEELILRKALEKKEAEENEKKEARKQHQDKLRMEMEKYRQELALLLEKQKEEDERFKTWEMQQRLQRDEYNKDIKTQDYERERLTKQKMAESLRRQIASKEAEEKRLKAIDNYSSEVSKAVIEETNEKILRYGEEVLKESEGVRPLFPIIKVVEQFKKEIGLKPPENSAKSKSSKEKKNCRQKRTFCAKPITKSQICYV